jgi:hypothetical protein
MLVHAAANMDPFGPLWDQQKSSSRAAPHSLLCVSPDGLKTQLTRSIHLWIRRYTGPTLAVIFQEGDFSRTILNLGRKRPVYSKLQRIEAILGSAL